MPVFQVCSFCIILTEFGQYMCPSACAEHCTFLARVLLNTKLSNNSLSTGLSGAIKSVQ